MKCAVKIGRDLEVDVTVISGEQLNEQGFGGQFIGQIKRFKDRNFVSLTDFRP